MSKNVFENLFHLDVNEHVEKKKTGSTTLSYLSWAWAWAEVKKKYPFADYEILKFENNLPYVYDENTGYMVFTRVTIEDVSHEMWLPVMDGANKAMKNVAYDYKTKYAEKSVEAASMFDINKTIMRCLVKNLAMFGLGLYIYSGEDLPQPEPVQVASEKQIEEVRSLLKEYAEVTGNDDAAGIGKLEAWALGQLKVDNFSEIPEKAVKPFMKKVQANIDKMKPKKEETKEQESLFEGSTIKPKA